MLAVEKERNRVFLLPGEFYVAKNPTQITTLLGSCVAVCLWSRHLKVAGMNHFLLPTAPGNDGPNTRYGDVAIATLVRSMTRLGCTPISLEARIFGGAAVFGYTTGVGGEIGKKNIRTADLLLAQHQIKILQRDVGGLISRKIFFDSVTGKVLVKSVKNSQSTCQSRDQKRSKIRVLTVDDSPTVLAIYKKIIELDSRFELIAQAHDAYEARDMVVSHNPDVIVMDIIMPKMNGLKFIPKLMKYHPVPVVVISTIAKVGSKIQNMALQVGACDVIDKECLSIYGGLEKAKNIMLPRLISAAKSKVGHRVLKRNSISC